MGASATGLLIGSARLTARDDTMETCYQEQCRKKRAKIRELEGVWLAACELELPRAAGYLYTGAMAGPLLGGAQARGALDEKRRGAGRPACSARKSQKK